MEIYLIRHTNLNIEKGVCYGQADIDVSSNIDKEAKNIILKLPDDMAVFSSPLKRCLALAEKLSDKNFTADERLKELDFGEWELMKWNHIDEKQLQIWIDDFINVKCPKGEAFIDLYKRSSEFFDELIKKDCQKVGIITHAGVIRSILACILDMPLDKAVSLQIDCGSVTKVITHGSHMTVEYINR